MGPDEKGHGNASEGDMGRGTAAGQCQGGYWDDGVGKGVTELMIVYTFKDHF